jgi:ATP-dependent exoDNAse (exonuclease V) beta subunit
VTEESADSRRTIIEALDRTLFVEAGAGSGKTSCLVDRFIALVESGVPADRIAAITFTIKAANELVERIRAGLAKRTREGSDLCRVGLSLLDRAAICTVHSFAQRILTEHPIEARLPPNVSVIEDIAATIAFEARWDEYVDRLLTDPQMERPVRLFLASGGTLDHLHDLAIAFDENWDLVTERAGLPVPAIPPLDVTDILVDLAEIIELAGECTSTDDKLFTHIAGPVTEFEHLLRHAVDDDRKLEQLTGAKLKCRFGQQVNWPDTGKIVVQGRLAALHATCAALAKRFQEAALQAMASSLAEFTREGAEGRRAAGELEFHDLLVLARAVLRDPVHGPEVRAALAARYQRLLIDEFQDTDPIQVELAVLIAADDPDAGAKDWRTVVPRPGHLFFVGDPKQAIYRFRRADIATFLDTRDCVVGNAETLDHNYRTAERVLRWVNATFGQLIQEAPGSQPTYTPLVAVRKDPDVGPAVAFIGREHEGKPRSAELMNAEAGDVAGAIRQAIDDGWVVSERQQVGSETWRPARWSDVAILLPGRGSLSELQPALESANIPFRVEASSLVFETREVRELMLIIRAVDDPTDSLSIVATLRTPSFGCGDDDLLVWRRRYGGSWDYLNAFPEGAPADLPVAIGLGKLRFLHEQRVWKAPSEILEMTLRQGRFFELGASVRRPRDLWRRLRFVLDQCRAWEEAGGVTLRQYLRWVAGQAAKGDRAKETVLPETDDDAVRILTIHSAKGLEFPIVVVSGLTSEMVRAPRGVQVRFPDTDGWAVRLKKELATREYEETVEVEEQRERDERIRLLYVATTRARDHLVVSVHRKQNDGTLATYAEVLYEAGSDPELVDLLEVRDHERPHDLAPDGPVTQPASELPSLEDWQRMHDAALAAAAMPIAISATGLAAGERNVDEVEVVPRGRTKGDGAAIGSAVHAVLQSIDLGSGDGLAEMCAVHASAEGVSGRADLVEALCRSALESDIVRRAAQSRHFREVYVGMPDGDRVLEGFIDLLYEDGDGVAIVDYKTDSWKNVSELDAKIEHYRGQMQAYTRTVRESVGREVVSATLLFLNRDGAVARSVEF